METASRGLRATETHPLGARLLRTPDGRAPAQRSSCPHPARRWPLTLSFLPCVASTVTVPCGIPTLSRTSKNRRRNVTRITMRGHRALHPIPQARESEFFTLKT